MKNTIEESINYTKVNDEISKKLSLIKTDIYTGSSFIYDLHIYEIPNKYKTYLCECDGDGEPFLNDTFLIRKERFVDGKKQVSYLTIAKDMILYSDIKTLMMAINEDFETNILNG